VQAAISQNPLQAAAGAIAQVAKWNAGAVPAGAGAMAGPGVFAVQREPQAVAAGQQPAMADLGRKMAAALGGAPAAAP
jgi:hypothetical protein